jgi:general secretion pathway protein G
MPRPFGQSRPSGFTLIEMTLVVGLIGVMLVIALPYYGDYRDRVKTSQAAHEIAGLEGLIELYRVSHSSMPDTLAEMQLGANPDPWGRPYAFYNIETNGKGHARKDHALNPLNTDYDLYSLGPDGVSKPQITQTDSLDDVIRASNGGYVGIATGF